MIWQVAGNHCILGAFPSVLKINSATTHHMAPSVWNHIRQTSRWIRPTGLSSRLSLEGYRCRLFVWHSERRVNTVYCSSHLSSTLRHAEWSLALSGAILNKSQVFHIRYSVQILFVWSVIITFLCLSVNPKQNRCIGMTLNDYFIEINRRCTGTAQALKASNGFFSQNRQVDPVNVYLEFASI